ncbi:ABC transporter ATP-binding protein [Halobaculum sp. CBA1158]|uniref:ABC transporter ATP-binding protein n=1 Tax=Halobaculum sp. CBA1158 TaxID=2904243 RepID=UPI001F300752|nr:ABC transporter ATP-binding protein [Halobaculum sp. CBA1158]UIO99737.1 ABC transporter ATP-binding protein [Halobaculum sp. CBA1158]
MSDPPALAARDLVVTRGGERVLDGVDVAVDRGDRVVIRGASGSGKSTLFATLGLLEPADAGVVAVAGRDASGLSERERATLRRDHLGIVFQDFQLVPDLDAWDNAALPQDHAGERDPDWLARLFDHLGIADLADRYPASLSGGEKQRVAIARALANRPAVVLADEPTGQLDPEATESVLDLLRSLREAFDAGVAVVSHDPAVSGGFDRRLDLVDGALTARDDGS